MIVESAVIVTFCVVVGIVDGKCWSQQCMDKIVSNGPRVNKTQYIVGTELYLDASINCGTPTQQSNFDTIEANGEIVSGSGLFSEDNNVQH